MALTSILTLEINGNVIRAKVLTSTALLRKTYQLAPLYSNAYLALHEQTLPALLSNAYLALHEQTLPALPSDAYLAVRSQLDPLLSTAELLLRLTLALPSSAYIAVRETNELLCDAYLALHEQTLDPLLSDAYLALHEQTLPALLSTALLSNAIPTIITLHSTALLGSWVKKYALETSAGVTVSLNGRIKDPKDSGFGINIRSRRMKTQRWVVTDDRGTRGPIIEFEVLFADTAEKSNFETHITNNSQDLKFFPGRSDKYYKIKRIGIIPGSNEPWRKKLDATLKLYLEEPNLYSVITQQVL